MSMSPQRPRYDDNDNDSEVEALPPEFAAIEAAARRKAMQASREGSSRSPLSTKVIIRVRLIPHPEDDTATVKIYGGEMTSVSEPCYMHIFLLTSFHPCFNANREIRS